jgi:hypothetical protein
MKIMMRKTKGVLSLGIILTILSITIVIIVAGENVKGWLVDTYRLGFYGIGEPGSYDPYRYYTHELKVYSYRCDDEDYVKVKNSF